MAHTPQLPTTDESDGIESCHTPHLCMYNVRILHVHAPTYICTWYWMSYIQSRLYNVLAQMTSGRDRHIRCSVWPHSRQATLGSSQSPPPPYLSTVNTIPPPYIWYTSVRHTADWVTPNQHSHNYKQCLFWLLHDTCIHWSVVYRGPNH